MKLSLLFLILFALVYLTGAVICLAVLPAWPVTGTIAFIVYTLFWLPALRRRRLSLSGFTGGDGI